MHTKHYNQGLSLNLMHFNLQTLSYYFVLSCQAPSLGDLTYECQLKKNMRKKEKMRSIDLEPKTALFNKRSLCGHNCVYLFKFKWLKLKSWFLNHSNHIPSAQKLNVATSYHILDWIDIDHFLHLRKSIGLYWSRL